MPSGSKEITHLFHAALKADDGALLDVIGAAASVSGVSTSLVVSPYSDFPSSRRLLFSVMPVSRSCLLLLPSPSTEDSD